MARRPFFVVFLALLVPFQVLADFETVVPSEKPFTKNIRFVVDVSGSMTAKRLSAAIATVIMVSEQPIDEMQIALVTFDDNHAVWPGKPEPDAYRPVPPNWAQLPNLEVTGSPEQPGELTQFISANLRGGSTDPRSALRAAFDDRKDLTVVIISDGEWQSILGSGVDGNLVVADPISIITQLQAARTEPANVVFYSVVEESEQNKAIDANFRRYAREYSGAYYRHKEVREDPGEGNKEESLPDQLPDPTNPFPPRIGPY